MDFHSFQILESVGALLPSFLAPSYVLSAGPVDLSIVQDPSPAHV